MVVFLVVVVVGRKQHKLGGVVVAVAGNKNKNVAVVEVYSFTIHGTVLK